jgi:hypothetical protein
MQPSRRNLIFTTDMASPQERISCYNKTLRMTLSRINTQQLPHLLFELQAMQKLTLEPNLVQILFLYKPKNKPCQHTTKN